MNGTFKVVVPGMGTRTFRQSDMGGGGPVTARRLLDKALSSSDDGGAVLLKDGDITVDGKVADRDTVVPPDTTTAFQPRAYNG